MTTQPPQNPAIAARPDDVDYDDGRYNPCVIRIDYKHGHEWTTLGKFAERHLLESQTAVAALNPGEQCQPWEGKSDTVTRVDVDRLTRACTSARSFADLLESDLPPNLGHLPNEAEEQRTRLDMLGDAYDSAQASRNDERRAAREWKA